MNVLLIMKMTDLCLRYCVLIGSDLDLQFFFGFAELGILMSVGRGVIEGLELLFCFIERSLTETVSGESHWA